MRRTIWQTAIAAAVGLGLGGPLAGEHQLPPSAKAPLDPIVCSGQRDLVIRDRAIHADGDAVVADGNCNLHIVDSHIMAGGVGVRADGNADVTIEGSFVQGRQGAVWADGNANVTYRGSTLRGGVGADGNADLEDAGGNLFEHIPAAAERRLRSGETLACADGDRLTVVHRYLESEGDGVVLRGDCELLLSDSHVRAAGAAVRIVGGGSLRLRNSTLEGGGHAVLVEGEGRVVAAGSNLEGSIGSGAGRFVDAGGNAWGSEASPSAGPVPGTSRARSSAGVKIGPGGVEVRGSGGEGGGRVKVGPGGIEIEGRGDGVERQPIRSCGELCELWPALTSGRQDCVAAVIDAMGYPIEETPDCIAVETEAQCRTCARVIGATDRACRTAYDRCLAR